MTAHRELYFKGESNKAESLDGLLLSHYDLIILSSSWDERSIAICKSEIKCETAILLLPDERDSDGLRDKHDSVLREWIMLNAVKSFEIESDDRAPGETWDKLYQLIVSSGEVNISNKRALIDLSASCRFYSLGIMAMLLRLGLCRQIDLIYSECEYQFTAQENVEFTSGQWQKKLIPFLDGDSNPAAPECSYISIGFEGLKTKRFLRSDEPDQIVLILPSPGFTSEYEERSEEEAASIIKEFQISEIDVIRQPAADAISLWRKLGDLRREQADYDAVQVSYICCGTKPQSLGLALHALAARSPAVYYIRPDSLKIVPTNLTGPFWRYRIEDLSQI